MGNFFAKNEEKQPNKSSKETKPQNDQPKVEVKKEETKKEKHVEVKKEDAKIETKSIDGSPTMNCPNKLHKYIIGQGGSIIKSISSSSGCKIDMKEDTITISGEEKGIILAKEKIYEQLEEVGWFFENNQWVERTKQDELWKKYRGEAEKEVKLRGEKFEQSKQAYESGNKELAKQLSDEAKVHDENFKRLNKEAGEKIFQEINQKNSETIIDLHGLFVEEALEFLQERIEILKGSGKKLEIITGAGNHSKDKALIKPKVIDLLNEKSLKFEEVKNGQIDVTF